jgi:aspartyl-tRNA(Asn)/glutamyl-tRNA(Gln) amidotransferase subunit C
MSTTEDEITKVALLARLEIPETSRKEVTERCSRVLNLVTELNTLDTNKVIPMSNPHDMEQRLRPDLVTRNDQRDELLDSAPASEQGYFLVPKVID